MEGSYYVKITTNKVIITATFHEEENTLEWLQGQVGGYIETIPLPIEGFVMIVNEEGKLNGLPENVMATTLADCMPFDCIVGDAVVLKEDGDEFTGMSLDETRILQDACGRGKHEG